MSYGVRIMCRSCKRSHDTYNYTYNLAPMFRFGFAEVGPHEDGLRTLHGMDSSAAAELLTAVIARLEREPNLERFDAANGWGYAAGALAFLREVQRRCADDHGHEVYVS